MNNQHDNEINLEGVDPSRRIGAIRTAWNGSLSSVAAAVLVWIIVNLGNAAGLSIDSSLAKALAASLLAVATPIFIAAFYEVSRSLSARWPVLGRILFGIGDPPVYRD